MNVEFRGKIWKVLCPKNLDFPPGVIKNLLIQRGKEKTITNLKNVKVSKNKFDMEKFLL